MALHACFYTIVDLVKRPKYYLIYNLSIKLFSVPYFLSFQSGKKTVKAVLWVSADGLRVVDDKTKVRNTFFMCCLCLLVLSSILSSFSPCYHSPDSKGMVHSCAFLLSCPQSCAHKYFFLCLRVWVPQLYAESKITELYCQKRIEMHMPSSDHQQKPHSVLVCWP